jgi:hypothetical protein
MAFGKNTKSYQHHHQIIYKKNKYLNAKMLTIITNILLLYGRFLLIIMQTIEYAMNYLFANMIITYIV